MPTTRLEAFSDGVIAVIITIMVLELKAPVAMTFAALTPQLPIFFSYALSFIYVGIYWNNHHHMLHIAQQVNGATLWANLHLLFWLSLVPFTTSWLGENYRAITPCVCYGVNLLLAALAFTILQRTIIQAHPDNASLGQAVGRDLKGRASLLIYVLGITCAFWQPILALLCYVGVAMIWLIPDTRIEQKIADEILSSND